MAGARCPDYRVFWSLHSTGSMGPYPLPCGAWPCAVCGRQKFEEMAARLNSFAEDKVWTGVVSPHWASAARQAARKHQQYLQLTLKTKQLYIVSGEILKGHGWSLEPEGTVEVLERFMQWPHDTPQRQSWGKQWKVEEVKEEKTPKLFHGQFTSMESLGRFLKDVGLTVGHTWTDDPEGLAEKISKARQPKPSSGKVRVRFE